jgi:hypothetical protein
MKEENVSNEEFGNNNIQESSLGMDVNEFLADVDKANLANFENSRKKVDLKEFTYNPKPGKVQAEGDDLRIVPPIEVGSKAYQKVDFHWSVGASKMIVCPSQFGRPCPVCEYVHKSKVPGLKKEEEDSLKRMEARTRHFLPVVIRGNEIEGPKWWGFNKTILNLIAGYHKNKYYGDISHVLTGNDINLVFPEGVETPNIMPVPIKSPLFASQDGNPDMEKINTLRASVKPISEVFIELPYDAIKKILDKALGLQNANTQS